MTLILGIEDPENNRAILCVDSGIWNGDRVYRPRLPKLWASKDGHWIASVCGMLWHANTARRIPFPRPTKNDRSTENDLVSRYVETVVSTIAQIQGEILSKLDTDNPEGFNLVVAYRRRVYSSSWMGDLSSPQIGIVAGGVGADVALGAALHSIGSDEPPIVAARAAMLIGAKHTRGCLMPIRWSATDGREGVWTE